MIDFSSLGAQVYSFSDCDGYCESQAVGLSVERDGAVIGTVAPATSVRFSGTLEAGDVVHILRDGTERAAVTYEGDRVFDGACFPPGTTEISGSLRLGDPAADPYPPEQDGLVDPSTALLIFRAGGFIVPEFSSPTRWHASLPAPLAIGGGISVLNDYRIVTPVGTATVWSWHTTGACQPTVPVLPMPGPPAPPAPPGAPDPPAPPPSCATALAADPAAAATVRRAARTLRLRALRRGRARLGGLPACPGGTLRISVTRRGRTLARVTTASDAGNAPKLRRVRRLHRRAPATVRVSVRLTDASGATATWRPRVTAR